MGCETFLKLVVDNSPSGAKARSVRRQRGKKLVRHSLDSASFSRCDDSRPISGWDAVPEVPLLNVPRLNPAVVSKGLPARPSGDHVPKATHDKDKVRNVPYRVKTHCTAAVDKLAGMDLPDIDLACERLVWARERKRFEGPTACARYFGWNVETYKKTETGERGMTEAKARRYGKGLGVDWRWLMYGPDAYAPTQFTSDEIALIQKYRRKGRHARDSAHQVLDSFPDDIGKPA